MPIGRLELILPEGHHWQRADLCFETARIDAFSHSPDCGPVSVSLHQQHPVMGVDWGNIPRLEIRWVPSWELMGEKLRGHLPS
jgi:hypothetical protein